MTMHEAMELPNNTPVRLADGSFGLLIHWYADELSVGVQVPGEDEIRTVLVARLDDVGGGALTERKQW